MSNYQEIEKLAAEAVEELKEQKKEIDGTIALIEVDVKRCVDLDAWDDVGGLAGELAEAGDRLNLGTLEDLADKLEMRS